MATTTTNLGLTLPAVSDAADIGVLNTNFQKLDEKCNPALFAPAGYGLGESNPKIVTTPDVALLSGFYAVANDAYSGDGTFSDWRLGYAQLFVRRRGGSVLQNANYNDTEWFRYSADSGATWIPWEWVNPPMMLGVEYRTTKRYDGHVVYTQMISCGKGPASGGANYYLNLNTNNIIFTQIRCKAVSPTSYWGVFLDHYISFGEYGSGAPCVSISADAGNQSNRDIYLIVEYYKV